MAHHLHSRAHLLHRNSWRLRLITFSWFAISLAGCANSCFVFNSNPPTGTINIKVSDPAPACTLPRSTGAVRVVAQAVSPCSSCSGADQVQHIFISLRGIALREGAFAPDDISSDWQELLPQLWSQPLQMDLMNPSGDPTAAQPLGQVHTISVGAYRQLRVRFVPNQAGPNDVRPENNACGTGFNCVVFKDGRVLPLVFDGAEPELRIASTNLAGGSLLVIPDAIANLVLNFRLSWVLSYSDGEGVHLVPTLSTSASIRSRE